LISDVSETVKKRRKDGSLCVLRLNSLGEPQ
jgi:hypothetical protein